MLCLRSNGNNYISKEVLLNSFEGQVKTNVLSFYVCTGLDERVILQWAFKFCLMRSHSGTYECFSAV
jgi:hypothetical protein